MVVRSAFLAINCPIEQLTQPLIGCKDCPFNEYESLISYELECGYANAQPRGLTSKARIQE